MTEKILNKDTLVPVGVVITVALFIISASVYIVNMSNGVSRNSDTIATLDTKVTTLESRISLIERNQTATDTKLDYIVDTLNEIRKKLNIN